jgi:hypothetical protein
MNTPSFQYNAFLGQEEILLNSPNDVFSAEHMISIHGEASDLYYVFLCD